MPADLSLLLPRPQHVDPNAGAMCLAFLNTTPRFGGSPSDDDLQPGYANVLSWSREAGVASDAETRRLLAVARRNAREASAIRRRIIELRETLRRLVHAMVTQEEPASTDLAHFERELRECYAHATLSVDEGTGAIAWQWPQDVHLEQLLWPILRSAEEILFSDRVDRIRKCTGEDCRYIFLDTSKNRSRRYCAPGGCGNRERVRRFRERATHP